MKLQTLYICTSALLFLMFSSCKKDLLRDNTNPNSVTVLTFDPNNLMTTTQLFYTGSSDNGIEMEETEIEGAGCMIQHWASTSPFFFGDKYSLSQGGFGSYFDHAYTYQVKNAVDLYEITSGKPQYKNLHQMARIVKAMIFERITDIYGDVPYFNAGLAYYNKTYFPKYDRQKDIYTDLLKEVEQATDSLDETADKPAGDLFFSGAGDQIAEWKMFGNTLLLRMAMRLTKVDPTTAQAYVKKVQGLTMQSNLDNAIVMHGQDQLTINKEYRGIVGDQLQAQAKLSRTFVDFLKNNNDPRLAIMSVIDTTGDTTPADQLGMPNGYDASGTSHGISHDPAYPGSLAFYSQPSDQIFNATSPTLVLTYAESEFLLADAAKRWGLGDPAIHYQNGVLAAITQLTAYGATVSGTDAQAYLTAHPYDDANGLEQINTQFWASTFFNEFEAWSNYRRTGYPVLVPVTYPASQSPGAIPRRMEYSINEKQVNTANYNAAVASISGGDKLTSRIWWDTL